MEKETINKIKDILEWIICIIIALVIAILFRYFVGTPTIVQQESMYPTLKPNQRLILNRIIKTSAALCAFYAGGGRFISLN